MLGAIPWGLPCLFPSPLVLDSQQPLGLDLVLLCLSSSKWAKMLTTVGAARGLSLLGVEGRPGQEASWLRGPLPAPARPSSPAGSVGAARALGPGLALPLMPGSSALSLGFLPGSAAGQSW